MSKLRLNSIDYSMKKKAKSEDKTQAAGDGSKNFDVQNQVFIAY